MTAASAEDRKKQMEGSQAVVFPAGNTFATSKVLLKPLYYLPPSDFEVFLICLLFIFRTSGFNDVLHNAQRGILKSP